jgi:hypothetical protein
MRLLQLVVLMVCSANAESQTMSVDTLPADGIVRVGDVVRMTLTLTNDAQSRPGSTFINASIAGLGEPVEDPPCVILTSRPTPSLPPFPYSMTWILNDLQPNEVRRCEARFVVGNLLDGVIPIRFRNSAGVTIASVELRGAAVTTIPALDPAGIIVLTMLMLAAAFNSGRRR